jgi:hypothetical protein
MPLRVGRQKNAVFQNLLNPFYVSNLPEQMMKKCLVMILSMGFSTGAGAVVPVITPESILCETEYLVEAQVVGGQGAKCQWKSEYVPVCGSYGPRGVVLEIRTIGAVGERLASGSRQKVRTTPVFRETFENSPRELDPSSPYAAERMGFLIFPHDGADISDRNVHEVTRGKRFIFGFNRDGRKIYPTGRIWPISQNTWIEDTKRKVCGFR